MSGDAVSSIQEKFLDTGNLFGLKFNKGYVFFEVEGWSELQYKPYEGIGEIPPGTNAGFQRLEHDGDDDILYMDKADAGILHVGIGQSPASVRRYTNYPEGENRLRTIPNLTIPRPANSSDFGFVDGNDTPYEGPTDAEELFIPPKVHLDFDFVNPQGNESVEPRLNIQMRQYDVNVLDPQNNEERNAIRRIVQPGSPMPLAAVGSLRNQTRFHLSKEWGVSPVSPNEVRQIRDGN